MERRGVRVSDRRGLVFKGRRTLLSNIGRLAAATAVARPAKFGLLAVPTQADDTENPEERATQSFHLRLDAAQQERRVPVPAHLPTVMRCATRISLAIFQRTCTRFDRGSGPERGT
jgi:hypothetical protein